MSAQLIGLHLPALQWPLVQSCAEVHTLPSAHGGHWAPQSTSVSVPFLIMSVQLGVAQWPAEQTRLMHWGPDVQVRPFAHGMHIVAPPQSTSPSLPFFTLSLHVGAWQVIAVQTWLLQSSGAAHARPSMQGGQTSPPQSVSVSVPLLMPSLQVFAAHEPATQVRPAGHSTPTHAASTQPPSKQTWVGVQLLEQLAGRHMPPAQTWPEGQLMPLQWRSTHTLSTQTLSPLHWRVPHVCGRQRPAEHASVAAHAWPH
jgi:hypothetical protein